MKLEYLQFDSYKELESIDGGEVEKVGLCPLQYEVKGKKP